MIIAVMLFSLIAGAVVQSVLPGIAFLGRARLPILMSIVIYYSLVRERGIVLTAAVLAGILEDALSPLPLGYSAVCLSILGIVVNRFKDDLFSESFLTTIVVGAAAGIMISAGMSILLWKGDLIMDPFWWIVLKAVGSGLLGAVCVPTVFYMMMGLDRMVGNVQEKRHPFDDEAIRYI